MANDPRIPESIFELAAIEQESWGEKLDGLQRSGVPLNANTFLTPQVIARRALANLYNTTVLAGLVYRDYDPDFSGKQGDTITVRTPAKFTAIEYDRATGLTIQNIREGRFSVTLDTLTDVSFAVTAEELTLDIDNFDERVLTPAMEAHVQKVDSDLAAALLATATDGGDTLAVTADATTNVITTATPHRFYDGNKVVFAGLTGGAGITAGTVVFVRDATATTFKVSATDGGAAIDITTNMTAGTVALAGGGTASKGASTAPNALIDARTTLTANKIPGMTRYAVVSPEQAGELLKDPLFVNADQRGDTDGLREASIGRKFGFDTYETQAFSGLDEGVAFHRDAVALVTRTLALPMGKTAEQASVASYKGLGLRVVKDYDMDQKQDVISIDFLYGIKPLRPAADVALDLS